MSNRIIEKLLNGAEVEWKPLGEVCEFRNGFAFKSNLFKENGLPIIRITNIDGCHVNLDDVKYFDMTDYDSQMYLYEVNKGDVLVAMSGATTGKIGYYDFSSISYLNQRVGKFIPNEEKLNNRYLYHFLLSKTDEIYIMSGGGAQPNLSSNKLMKDIKIPIPPLSIQEKIVKILDKFTELEATLEATLEAELSLRVKQYHYYRDLLLNENEKNPFFKNAEYRCLGDITLLSSNIRWKNNTNSYKYIDLTSVDRENHSIGETIEISALTAPSRAQKLVVKDDVIFATTRPTQLRFAFINEEFENSIASTGYCVLRANTDLALPKWIYHNLGSIDFKNFLEENQSGSAYPAVSDSKVKEYKIPVPSLDIQEKIILILDKFENLANSIKDGLPREIELRRKQYEYYRNELLSFSNQGG